MLADAVESARAFLQKKYGKDVIVTCYRVGEIVYANSALIHGRDRDYTKGPLTVKKDDDKAHVQVESRLAPGRPFWLPKSVVQRTPFLGA